jgi:hypothetical protein
LLTGQNRLQDLGGILPGYEFPTQPATLRLLNDPHEDDPVSTERRFGTAQFQPEAPVYARTKRWRVAGLDTSSPWNPNADAGGWLYRVCRTCKLTLLRLLLPVPSAMGEDAVRPWGVSLGYALRMGMRRRYVLDGSELEFELEGPWEVQEAETKCKHVSLTFIDPSLGGTGYLDRIAEDFHLVARSALDHLDHEGCEIACYRCLKSYQNQRYHDVLNWPLTIPYLEALSQDPPQSRPLETGDLDDPRPWLEAFAEGCGSPLELKFWRLFQQNGFAPQKQVPVSPSEGEPNISVADFAVPERRLAIYIDSAAFHTGANLRRDRYIRERLRNGNPPWRVEELRAADLAGAKALVARLVA